MTFHETLFPLDIALNSEGGPERRTDIVTLASGHEVRNSPWAMARRRYNAGYGVKSLSDIETVISFFEARQGRLHAFRFRDPFDHKSSSILSDPAASDQSIGIGDGETTIFLLVKSYVQGGTTVNRRIEKPVAGSIAIEVNGAAMAEGDDFDVDYTSGAVTFAAPPPEGAAITAGFIFDTPVRFDTDQLQISLAAFRAGDIPSIPMIEVYG